MAKHKNYPTKSKLLELFDYHPEGYLKRKSTGKLNGVSGIYSKIFVEGEYYLVHKCIFIMHSDFETFEESVKDHAFKKHQAFTQGYSEEYIKLMCPFTFNVEWYVVDHEDQDKKNNRIENLRLLTHEENWKNSKATAKWHHFKYAVKGGAEFFNKDKL
jgi:hypothetical protein